MKQNITTLIFIVLITISFILGYKSYTIINKPVNNGNNTIVTGNITTNTTTTIGYVPKPKNDNTDIKMNIPKTDLIINVNGKRVTFDAESSENYLFEKNRLELDQSSKVNFSVTVKPTDLTKRWGIGVGYIDRLTGIITGPIVGPFDFIGVINDKTIGAGAIIRF